jgi:hypothetical protein
MRGVEEHFYTCPYCWETISSVLDLSAAEQAYVEDCEVCCRPIELTFTVEDGALGEFSARSLDG